MSSTPARTSLDSLTRQVTGYFRRHAGRFGLRAEQVEARYILNWGGFVNASFQVTDGQRSYHLKLASDEGQQEALLRWQSLHEILEERYHAPRMVDWIRIPRSPFAGPLFDYISGRQADFDARPDLLQEVLDLLRRLHADRDLAAALAEDADAPPTCADYFLDVYIDRFDEDLLSVAGELPPFVPLSLLDWMMGETRELEGLVREMPAFQVPAGAPTHGDLWPSNILVTGQGDWYVIDWDDLALGDPALEYSIVLGPFWRRGLRTREALHRLLPPGEALRERFDLCLRALLLDEVIDPLADWVESGFAPEHQDQVRAGKERQHREALELYRQWYRS